MMIADYFASFKINIDKSSVAQVDKTLDVLEAKIAAFGARANKGISLKLSTFEVNQRALNLAIGTALDIASTRNTLEISRFHIDQTYLNTALVRAMTEATRLASESSMLRPRVSAVHGTPGAVSEGSRVRAAAVGGGLIGRGVSGLYGPALALGLGGYGLSELNKRNQEVVAAQLQSQAVISGNAEHLGITGEQATEQGKQSFDWLRKQANRIGFNYLDASGDYNNLLSNLIGSGGTVAQGQNIFKGFAEYGRVNKLTPARQKLVFNALSQIAGKDKLQAEELTKQLGNSLPGAKDIFAQAYQQQLKETGKGKGDLTGSAAIIALEKAMKGGEVRGNILNYAANIASQKSEAGLGKAQQASQAEQAKYQNSVNDLAVIASDAGVEEGFARIFRTLNAGLTESGDLVKNLAEGFNDVTKWADDLLLFPQSFVRALQGRDSLVADWLGLDKAEGLISDWTTIKTIWDQLTGGPKPDWLPTLQATSKELAEVLKQGAEFAKWLKALKDSSATGQQDASFATQPITASWQALGRLGSGISSGIDAAKVRGSAVYDDPSSPYYHDPARYDSDMAAGINRYKDLSSLQNTGIDDTEQFQKDAEEARLRDKKSAEFIKSVYPKPEWLKLQQPSSNMGVFDNYENVTPSGQQFQDLSQYNPQSPAEIEDYNKTLALSQAETAASSKTVNNFDININVDATLAGVEIEAQAQAAASAFSTALKGAFDQAQVNWPTK